MSYHPEHLLNLLQHFLKHIHQINQIHTLLVTNGHLLFNPNSNPKWISTLLYNTLIRAHLNFNNPNKVLLLFTNMLAHQALPNSHTFPSLTKAISSSPSIASRLGQPLHTQVIKRGLSLDPFIQTSFVRLYAQLGRLPEAQKVFEEIPEPSIVSTNSMLDALGKKGDMGSALWLFGNMPEHDIVSWTSIINGLGRNGMFEEALRFFRKMIREAGDVLRPNEATLVSVLSSCSSLHRGGFYQGKQIHSYIITNQIEITVFTGTALIAMYGKTGCLGNARKIFSTMELKEVCTWNALISSLAINGIEREALFMFDKMRAEGLRPNAVTFVAVLTSCARGKFVDLGLRLFESMFQDFGIVPRMEHYGCIVDLFGRAGLLKEANEFIKRMPFEADATVLGALLGACKVYGNVELAGEVGKRIIELQPKHCGRYVVLSNIYAEAGRWGNAAEFRKTMLDNGVQKICAHSWVGLT